MPPRFKQLYDYSWGYYSPGICPTQYVEGCSFPTALATTGQNRNWVSYGGEVEPGETPRICCPDGYTCIETGIQTAYSLCAATTDPSELAYAIQVRWQQSDLSILATDPTVPGKTYSPPATSGTATVLATATGASATSPCCEGTGTLATPTVISIAVAIGASAFALAFIGFCLWNRKRKQRAALGTRLGEPGDQDGQASGGTIELDSKALGSSTAINSELDSNPVAEMPNEATFCAELPGDMPYHEKESPHVYHEKDNDLDTRSQNSKTRLKQEDGPVTRQPRRGSAVRASSQNLEPRSPDLTSPASWTSTVQETVSDMTDRDNGRTL